jgi:rubrerythrin
MIKRPDSHDKEKAWKEWYNYYKGRSISLVLYSAIAKAAWYAAWDTLAEKCDQVHTWRKAWKAYARHARDFAREAHDAAAQHQAIHMALYIELENRLIAGMMAPDGGWEYSCRVCGVRGSNHYALKHAEDCPLSIPDNIRSGKMDEWAYLIQHRKRETAELAEEGM